MLGSKWSTLQGESDCGSARPTARSEMGISRSVVSETAMIDAEPRICEESKTDVSKSQSRKRALYSTRALPCPKALKCLRQTGWVSRSDCCRAEDLPEGAGPNIRLRLVSVAARVQLITSANGQTDV